MDDSYISEDDEHRNILAVRRTFVVLNRYSRGAINDQELSPVALSEGYFIGKIRKNYYISLPPFKIGKFARFLATDNLPFHADHLTCHHRKDTMDPLIKILYFIFAFTCCVYYGATDAFLWSPVLRNAKPDRLNKIRISSVTINVIYNPIHIQLSLDDWQPADSCYTTVNQSYGGRRYHNGCRFIPYRSRIQFIPNQTTMRFEEPKCA
ncbi:hypothetical protein AGLY_004980 [Aphis glycines]|uniref:Uncharacterized protein n=1 Tax=Aphis glycines TaxID=307491 RepID=A0A6G0TVF6_APHGL|nr:hypothetical protein AGLY_004980 [Aphis glycines]